MYPQLANSRLPMFMFLTCLLEDDLQLRGDGQESHPDKPRRRFLIILVASIITRLELFHRVSEDLQCSTPGIEVCESHVSY